MPDQTMTDAFIQGGQLGASQAASAQNSAANWASTQAEVQLKRQTLQQQQEYLEITKQKHEAELGQTLIKQMGDVAPLPKGPYKTSIMDAMSDYWDKAGHPVDPTWMAAMEDPSMQPNFPELAKLVPQLNPDVGGKALAGAFPLFGKQLTPGLIETMVKSGYEAVATQNRIANSQNIAGNSLSARQVDKAAALADKVTFADKAVLGTVKRVHDLIDAVKSGEIVDTPQLLAALNTEKAKIEQAGKLTEGAQERARNTSIENWITKKIQMVTNSPKSANIMNFATQISGESDAVASQYMKSIDTSHNQLRGTFSKYPDAVQALDSSFDSLRKDTASPDLLGKWNGLAKYKIDPAQGAAPAAQAPAPKKYPPELQGAVMKTYEAYKRAVGNGDQDKMNQASEALKQYRKVSPQLMQQLNIPEIK